MAPSIKAAAILFSSLVVIGCSHKEPDARLKTPLVRVAMVGETTQPERAFTGVVSARVQSDLGFRIPGKIVERLVDTGDSVKLGQPLMRIDRTDLSLATAARAAAVAAAQARALQTAADELRYRGLVDQGAVSASAYDLTKAAALSAKAELDAARAQNDVSKNEASYSVLCADSDGVVVETLAEPGQVVAAGQTVIKLAHAGPREATISLPETLRPAIGSVARASLYNGSGAMGTAKLRQLSSSADVRTRTFDARYVLEGAAANSPLGSTVTILLADAREGSSTIVPLSAIYDVGRGPGVWIVGGDASRVSWRPVTLAAVGTETATLSSGLGRGDRFVTLGAHLLHEGDSVRIAGSDGAAK
ncbi:efflux RND transporter periplasmic adaptor subunit [Nevskia soli]|uniref:efflux RND transporter periplasmic adaptor subunit n=1 Tax=Nevskia soli TaxID=418856 RepID=UPI0009FDBCE9|nr:efflux RND transporter periplasmic adaptor subunit [Nevskia soli]